MKRGVLVIVALLALAGCGESDKEPAVKESTPSASPTPTPSDEPTIVVSANSTCSQLFAADEPLSVVIDWWTNSDGYTQELRDALDEIEEISQTAGPELRPFLETVVEETRLVAHGTNTDGDSTLFKAAAYEVTAVCDAAGF